MRTRWSILVVTALAVLATRESLATDFDCEFAQQFVEEQLETESVEPISITIYDREWRVLGIEQTNQYLPPREMPDFTKNDRSSYFPWESPQLIDDIAWPLTRAIFRGAGQRMRDIKPFRG